MSDTPVPESQPQRIHFTPAEAAQIVRVEQELVRLFGSTRAAAAANLVAVGLAKARGITLEQHGHELGAAHHTFDTLAAGGGVS